MKEQGKLCRPQSSGAPRHYTPRALPSNLSRSLESIAWCILPVCASVVQACFTNAGPQGAVASPGNLPRRDFVTVHPGTVQGHDVISMLVIIVTT